MRALKKKRATLDKGLLTSLTEQSPLDTFRLSHFCSCVIALLTLSPSLCAALNPEDANALKYHHAVSKRLKERATEDEAAPSIERSRTSPEGGLCLVLAKAT